MMPFRTLFFILINLSADVIVIFLLYSYDASIDTFRTLFFYAD